MSQIKITRPQIFYGWWLVVVCLLIMAVGTGTSLYLYSVIADSLKTAYPSGRLLVMMGATIFFLSAGLMSPRLGAVLDRYPVKHVLSLGAVVMGAGFMLIAISTNIWQVIICYGVFIGAGMATLSSLATATLLSRWFVRHRGLALGIAALGTQFGGLVFPPVVAYLTELFDWRIAVAMLGLFIMVAVPLLVFLTVKDYPSEMGLHQDGDSKGAPAGGNTSQVPAQKLTLRYLYTQKSFVMLVVAMGCASAVNVAIISNLALFATDMGESRESGAYLVSLLSILGMVFSPLVGRWCDIWNIKFVGTAMFLASALAGLLFASAGSYSLLLLATFVQGVVGGSILPLWASLLGRLCDSQVYGRAMGGTIVVVYAMTALAPAFSGWIYDITGSYRLLFLLVTLLMVVAAWSVGAMRLPRVPREKIGLQGLAS